MYSGPNTHTEGLVFGYDTGYGIPSINESRFFKGAPTVSHASLEAYSIYNSGATNYRNQSFPPPPTPGYEVVKVIADTFGSYGQSILWRAIYPNNNVVTATNSIYAWLESGTYVQVGQHWFPWNYGAAQYIEKGKWVRIKETYTINEGNSYGNAGLVYSTDGVAYFSMPQYEYNSYGTPYAENGYRGSTDSLIDLARNSSINVSNVSFNSSGQPTFDGTDDYIPKTRKQYSITENWSVETVFKPTNDSHTSWNGLFGGQLAAGGYWMFHSSGNLTYYEGYDGSTRIRYSSWTKANTFNQNVYHHLVITYTSTSSTTGTYTVYYNGGEKIDTFNWTFTFSHSLDSNYIGMGAGNRFGTNDIHVYREYNQALTAQEVYNNYLAYKGRFGI